MNPNQIRRNSSNVPLDLRVKRHEFNTATGIYDEQESAWAKRIELRDDLDPSIAGAGYEATEKLQFLVRYGAWAVQQVMEDVDAATFYVVEGVNEIERQRWLILDCGFGSDSV